MASPKNLASIQFLRFVAATLVVFDHTIAVEFPAQRVASGLGAAGVHIFFVISGFIMLYTSFSGSKRRMSPRQFLSRRFIRIFPIYWIYAAIFLAFGATDASFVPSASNLAGSLLLLPGYSSQIIGPGWTLSYELYFYLCFAVIMIIPMPMGLFFMAAFFAISIFVRWSLHLTGAAFDTVGGSIILDFVIGAFIGWIATNDLRPRRPWLATALIIVSVGWLLFALAYDPSRTTSVLMWGIPSGMLVAGVVFLDLDDRLPRKVKQLSFLGDSSYSLYLLHILFLGWLAPAFLSLKLPSLLACLSIVVICAAMSAAAYRLLERPMVSMLQNAAKRTKPRRLIPTPRRTLRLGREP